MEASRAPYVFISYARSDRAMVDRLVADLEAAGIITWIDAHGLKAGTPSWEQTLRDAIRTAQAVLLVASPHSRASRYVADELRIAEMYQRTVLPLWLAGEQWMECVPLGWGGTQHLDGRDGGYQEALRELVEVLRDEAPPPAPVAAPARLAPGLPPRNPFKGLRAFGGGDSGDFFGRGALVDALLEAMRAHANNEARFLALVGPSGSGKSSVVLAGLLPRLRQGALPGSGGWTYLEPLVPGAHPLEALTVALGNALPGSSLTAIREDLTASVRGLHLLASKLVRGAEGRVVLVLDQAEELFSPSTDEDERRQCIDLLTTAAGEPRGPLWLLLTLRADFYDGPMRYPALGALIERYGKSVLPMNLAELRTAIEGPAALPDVQLRFEADLVGDLLFEVRGEAGALPLLQFTLDQLFAHRDGRLLTRAAYQQLGGVRGALARHAETAYAGLPSDEHRGLARALFLRLIDPGVTEQDTTRRRAALTELELPDPARTALLREVVDAFIAARLLVAGEHAGVTTIEVSHEALIREWGRLADWLRAAREDIRLQQALSADTAEWGRRGRPADRVYRGELLAEALTWAGRNTPSAAEAAFLAAAQAEQDRQLGADRDRQARELRLAREAAQAGRQSAARLRYLAGVLVLFLLVASGLTVFALKQASTATTNERAAESARAAALAARSRAEAQRIVALSRQLAAQAVAHTDDAPDLALLLSVAAYKLSATTEATDSLLRVLEHDPRLDTFLRGHTGPVLSLVFSHDGRMLVSSGADQEIRRWNPATGALIGLPLTGHTDRVTGIAMSADGRWLASASSDATIRLWDLSQRQPASVVLSALPAGVTNLAFSPVAPILAYGAGDATIRLWNVATGAAVGQPLTDHSSYVTSVAFSPNGRLLAAGADDGSIRLWDLRTGRSPGSRLTGHGGRVTSLAFSPDGRQLASGSADETVRLWRLTGTPGPAARLTGPTDRVTGVAFSPDGRTLAAGSADGAVRLWHLGHGQPVAETLPGQTGAVNGVAFSPDGTLLAAANGDGTIWLRRLGGGASLGRLLTGHTDVVNAVAFSPDSTRLVSGSGDTTVRLWDVPGLRPWGAPLSGHSDTVTAVAFSPDGHTVASGSNDRSTRLWDARSGRLVAQLPGAADDITSLVFSPNGRLLASSSADGAVRMWDVRQGRASGQPLPASDAGVNDVAISPDGRWLAAGNDDGSIYLWNLASRRRVELPFAGDTGAVNAVAFSPDGTRLVSGSGDKTVRLWSVATGQQLISPLIGHTDSVTGVAFSPDGALLASSSLDGTVRLWDAVSGQPIGTPLLGHTDAVNGLAFSPDGTLLASASSDTTVRLWEVSVAVWEQRACRIANRDLNALEWKQYLGDEPRRRICPAG